jgi:cellobiose PTS system EIIA component
MVENSQIAYSMIAAAGDAQALQFQALAAAKKADFVEAQTKMEKAEELLLRAHQIQTNLLKEEAGGTKSEVSVLLVHAQGYVNNTILNKKLIEEFIDLYKELRQ